VETLICFNRGESPTDTLAELAAHPLANAAWRAPMPVSVGIPFMPSSQFELTGACKASRTLEIK
jgi:hypothetical protein